MTRLPADLLDGRVAFLTGGGSGVTLGIARVLASCGADIAICGRNPDKLAGAAEELRGLGVRACGYVADVRDLAALEAAFARCDEELGRASIVVGGAAGNFAAPAEQISTNGFSAVVNIDLLGSFHTARAAFPRLSATRGSLLFLSGAQAAQPFAHQAHVGAAKAGIESMVRTLAVEWGRHGVRVNCLLPGPVEDTEGMRILTGTANRATWEGMVPLGRFATQDEIGQVATFLLSPLGSYITGTCVVADGGLGLSGPGAFNALVARATPS